MKTYEVHVRVGYYPPESDIAHEAQKLGIVRLPRTFHGTIGAANASDASAKMIARYHEQTLGLGVPLTPVPEPVAVTEVMPTHAELVVIADQQAADERAHTATKQAKPRRHDVC